MNSQQFSNPNIQKTNEQNVKIDDNDIPIEIKNNQIYKQFDELLEKKIYPIIQKKMQSQQKRIFHKFRQKVQFRPKLIKCANKQQIYNVLQLDKIQHGQTKIELLIKQEEEDFVREIEEFRNIRKNCFELFYYKRRLCQIELQKEQQKVDKLLSEIELLKSLSTSSPKNVEKKEKKTT